MKILISGATGFLGSHVLNAAFNAGHEVAALRRHKQRPRVPLIFQPTWLEGGLKDKWETNFRKTDVLIHLAAAGVNSRADDFERCFEVNVKQSLHFLQQAAICGIKKFIVCGSCFEYGRTGEEHDFIPPDACLKPLTAYAASKASASMAAIALANEYMISLSLIRPFHLFGPGESKNRFWPMLVRAALLGKDFYMTEGKQIRDFTPVGQAAQEIIQITNRLDDTNSFIEVRNLGTGIPQTLECFARSQWALYGAKGDIHVGRLNYRKHEVMRYIPKLA